MGALTPQLSLPGPPQELWKGLRELRIFLMPQQDDRASQAPVCFFKGAFASRKIGIVLSGMRDVKRKETANSFHFKVHFWYSEQRQVLES